MKIKKTFFVFILFIAFSSYAQEYDHQWKDELNAFDSLNGDSPSQGGILFTGSSSIKFWKDPVKDFNNPQILNRGFGGSQIIDLIVNFDQVILKYHPKKIVIYSGDNAIKPSLNRWSKVLEMKKANTMINEYLNTKSNGYFVDIFSPMIGAEGKPCKKWFVEDGLHMTKEEYQL